MRLLTDYVRFLWEVKAGSEIRLASVAEGGIIPLEAKSKLLPCTYFYSEHGEVKCFSTADEMQRTKVSNRLQR